MEDLQQALQRVEAEERELTFPSFTAEDGLALGNWLVEAARRIGKPLVVDVERGGLRLFHHAMEGTTPDNEAWIERKRRVVHRWRRSSWAMGLVNRSKGRTLADLLGPAAADYADHGGGFPIVVRGAGFVGTVIVSGLPQQEDHDLVVEGLRALLSTKGA